MRGYLPLFAYVIFCKSMPNRSLPCWQRFIRPQFTALTLTEVEIEVNAGAGDPKMVIVGLPGARRKGKQGSGPNSNC